MAKKNLQVALIEGADRETPMMKQYNQFKAQYPGAILLFRVGDFYETFGEDAIKASQILGITLTKRHNGAASETELAGFPHHALEAYLPKLVKAGQRVAICDQLEDPRFAKKIVKRGVTELVTPGVSYNDTVLDGKRNNYLASLCTSKGVWGIALIDITTGEFLTTEGTQEYMDKLLQSFSPAEVLISRALRNDWLEWTKDNFSTYYLEDWFFQTSFGEDILMRHFRVQSLKGFGIADLPQGIAAAGAIMHYLSENNHKDLKHIAGISRIEEERYVWLDKFTIRNLELLAPQQQGGVALIDVLDKTLTNMGARLLRKWIALPLKDKNRIEERLSIVDILVKNEELLGEIQDFLKQVGDVERLISKVSSRRAKPREVLQLKKALIQIAKLKKVLEQQSETLLHKFSNQLNPCEYLAEKIEKELLEDLKNVTNEGGLIRDGVNKDLDELRDMVQNSKDYLEKVRQNAAMETGINSLKIEYNKVFGYYLEVSNANQHKVPKTWIRKQTLTNAERYITEELKIYEDKIVTADEKINILEQQLFLQLVESAGDFTLPIQQNGRVLAMLDCLANFAQLACKKRYTKPTITEGKELDIKAGRHVVIEEQLPPDEPYIPNDTYLDVDNQQIIVITGPNMAGKSALLRQTALVVIMAQIGCFVPAESATIGVVDKIFTRVGASDNLAKGESTFMVEMMETASIMNNLSDRSLVLMDEIGRGTSTYDGISIAWALLEFLHNHPKYRAKTLFATHYHELNELANDLTRIRNYHVTVRESGNRIIFLRKLAEGGSEHSFGIHVAQMAGMPPQVVQRANEIMHFLEAQRQKPEGESALPTLPKVVESQSIQFVEISPEMQQVMTILERIDINTLSPVEALLKLNELKNLIK
jgi:DNA mismatch repair protein MutS